MKVQIEGNIYLESDELQFFLKRYLNSVDKRSGEHKSSIIGYYPNFSGVMKSLIRMKLNESNAKTLQELHEDYIRIEVWAKGLFSTLEREAELDDANVQIHRYGA